MYDVSFLSTGSHTCQLNCDDSILVVIDVTDADCEVDMMHAVNPNLAMTNCGLEPDHNERDAAAEVCCGELYQTELNQTEYAEPEIYMWTRMTFMSRSRS